MASKKKIKKLQISPKTQSRKHSKILDADKRSKELPPRTPNVIVMAHPSLYKHPFTRKIDDEDLDSRANHFAKVYDSLFKKRH